MARLRVIYARYNLAARQHSYAWPMMPPFGLIAQAKYGWQMEAVWANGVRLDCEESFARGGDLKEALKNFFTALGNKHN